MATLSVTPAWRRLSARLVEPASQLSSSRHRFYIASNFLYLFGFFGHAAFISVFALLGNRFVSFYNLLCIGTDAACLWLNLRGRAKSAFAVWISAVTLHTVLCTLTYGWDAGFHYYILSLSVFIFLAPWSSGIKLALTSASLLAYLLLHAQSQLVPSWSSLTPFASNSSNYINISVNFFALAYLLWYHAFATEKAERALEESKRTLATTLSASPVGIARVIERCICWVNPALCDMLGELPASLIGQSIHRFCDALPDTDQLAQALYNGASSHNMDLPEVCLTRADGSRMVCHLKARALDAGDPSQGAILAVVDLSALKAAEQEKARLEAQVRHAEKMEALGTLAGGVAHDLNNILSGILSYPDLLLLDLPSESPLRRPLSIIKKAGERSAAIVQDLLTLARRGLPFTPETIDLNTVVRDYLESPECQKLKDENPALVIASALDEKLFNISASPIHMAKVVMNLVTNAAEAMPLGGTIRIQSANRYVDRPVKGYDRVEVGDYVVLTVADGGEGIPAPDLEHIFEPFFTKKHLGRSGSGLGLAVVWGVVQDSRGYIEVVSQNGRGSIFTLYFPATRQSVTPAFSDSCLTPLLGNGQSVLVVDDAEEQRAVATAMLTRLGYAVATAPSGEAALEMVKARCYDLVLLDMILGEGFDGLDTYRHLLERCPAQRAIIASGFSETDRVLEALRLGARLYLKKPYTLKQLATAVKETLAAG